jgi:hypothetical protein
MFVSKDTNGLKRLENERKMYNKIGVTGEE